MANGPQETPKRIHIHPLTGRGFFSEYMLILWVVLFCRQHDIEFQLAANDRSIVSRSFARELFNVECLSAYASNVFKLNYRISQLGRRFFRLGGQWMRNPFPPPLSQTLWNREYETDLWRQVDVLDELHRIHLQIWKGPSSAVSGVDLLGSEVKRGEYVAMHVRRGDKLIREAVYVAPEVFLRRIPDSLRQLPIVVLTDDYQSFLDVRNCLSVAKSETVVLTPARPSARGHDHREFMSLNVKAREDLVRTLLVEFDLLCGASFVVCSLSSNIGRAVHIARRGRDTSSVDTPFMVVQ